jgi:hypothetical protein
MRNDLLHSCGIIWQQVPGSDRSSWADLGGRQKQISAATDSEGRLLLRRSTIFGECAAGSLAMMAAI